MVNAGGDAVAGTVTASAGGRDMRSYVSAGSWVRFLVPAVLGLTLDLWVKAWSFPNGVPAATMGLIPAGRYPAENGESLALIPGFLKLTTTVNHGAVFGLFQGKVLYFLLFSILAMGVIVWVFLASKRDQWLVHLSLGLITAGALGNLYDRAVFNGVRDMLEFYVKWYPWIFNVADALLCLGVPLLMVRWTFGKE